MYKSLPGENADDAWIYGGQSEYLSKQPSDSFGCSPGEGPGLLVLQQNGDDGDVETSCLETLKVFATDKETTTFWDLQLRYNYNLPYGLELGYN